MKDTVLIIIDVQQGLIDSEPYKVKEMLDTISQLENHARAQEWEVIYIRHADESLPADSSGWQLAHRLSPVETDLIVDKHFNSIFKETQLQAYLQKKGIKTLVMCGMATNYCVDTSIRVAFEYDYHVIVPQGGTSTFDSDHLSAELLQSYYENIWNNRFAQVKKLEDIITERNL